MSFQPQGDLPDVRGLAVQAALLAAVAFEAELGGDDHFNSEGDRMK